MVFRVFLCAIVALGIISGISSVPSSYSVFTGNRGSEEEASSCRCGLAKRSSEARIIGGEHTEVNEYPWQVALVEPYDPTYIFCGGALISDQWVLTAAHCTIGYPPSATQVLLGEHDRTTSKETDSLIKNLALNIVHPNYDTTTLDNDVALLKLDSPIDFSQHNHIRPICLPASDESDFAGQNAIIKGWGLTEGGGDNAADILKEIMVEVIGNPECSERFSKLPGNPPEITEQMMCILGRDSEASCHGDSGGSLVSSGSGDGVTAGQNYQLIGIVSWGDMKCKLGLPNVFARVSKFLDWIKTTTSGSFDTCPRT